MEVPLRITFRDMEPSAAVEAKIRERVQKLERLYPRLVSCHVVVTAPHHHHQQGKLYRVRIAIGVAGNEIIVDRTGPQDHAHEDTYVAIRDAFDAARRRLEDHIRERRQDIKTHDIPAHGRVVRLFPFENYGFIESSDGQEIYFHRNSVIDDKFNKLTVGSEVRFTAAERESEKGAQATSVHLIGKHHVSGP